VKTPERAAQLLTQGLLERKAWPELADEHFAAEVEQRLAAVGLQLASGGGYWVARSMDGQAPEGFEPLLALDEAELALLAALYLHLRYLPRQSGNQEEQEEPSVAVEDIERGFPYKVGYARILLGRLTNARFVERRDHRLYAGPYLSALDEVAADERASELLSDFRLRRQLRRFLTGEEELEPNAAD
jgi:hypothetical protein